MNSVAAMHLFPLNLTLVILVVDRLSVVALWDNMTMYINDFPFTLCADNGLVKFLSLFQHGCSEIYL
uniref:Uncharacterized protein n=1 Tax=Rhizophora mucronata TaxID=61149 RepID=A0A2P2NPQ0_RHIMU